MTFGSWRARCARGTGLLSLAALFGTGFGPLRSSFLLGPVGSDCGGLPVVDEYGLQLRFQPATLSPYGSFSPAAFRSLLADGQ